MKQIVTYNLNGIRAASKQGILNWMQQFDADLFCFQEVRASEQVAKSVLGISEQIDLFSQEQTKYIDNFNAYFNCGSVPGYAGTLVLSKQKANQVFYNMGEFWHDNEGRTTTLVFDSFTLVNTYVPNGNTRLAYKMQYLSALQQYLKHLGQMQPVICVGDFNIAHNEIDLTHPKECANRSVFLPIERKAFNDLLAQGLTDCFRHLNPETKDYTWRSYRSRNSSATINSWKYRIDYVLVSNAISQYVKKCQILELPYSDHLPVAILLKCFDNQI